MEVSARVNCGYPGISPEDCASRKCCFSDTIPEVPWCFFPKPVQGTGAEGAPSGAWARGLLGKVGAGEGVFLPWTSCLNATEALAPDPGVAITGDK